MFKANLAFMDFKPLLVAEECKVKKTDEEHEEGQEDEVILLNPIGQHNQAGSHGCQGRAEKEAPSKKSSLVQGKCTDASSDASKQAEEDPDENVRVAFRQGAKDQAVSEQLEEAEAESNESHWHCDPTQLFNYAFNINVFDLILDQGLLSNISSGFHHIIIVVRK